MDLDAIQKSVYCLSENMVMETFDDGALILNVAEISFFELNSTARDVLKHTNGNNTLKQVAELLAGEYEIKQEEALGDVAELYQNLVEQGIIEAKKL